MKCANFELMQNQRYDGFNVFVNDVFFQISKEIQFMLTVKTMPIGYLQLVDDFCGGSKITLYTYLEDPHVSINTSCVHEFGQTLKFDYCIDAYITQFTALDR